MRAPCSPWRSRRRAGSRCRRSTRSASACCSAFRWRPNVAPGFSILDEATATLLQREAIDASLRHATANPGSPAGEALAAAIPFAADDRFEDILRAALQRRRWLEDAVRMAPGDDDDTLAELYRRAFGVREDVDEATLITQLSHSISDIELRSLREELSGGGTNDRKGADKIAAALGAGSPLARVKALEEFFCTGKGEARASLLASPSRMRRPDLDALASEAQERFVALLHERKGLLAVNVTIALHRLAGDVMERYGHAKARRAALDYEDLIAKTASLLREARSASWVLFKLDRGIDHILVDEAQDTSPEQWQIIEALAQEFFSGSGQREEMRTLFAVGDEKQSIYSFQGRRAAQVRRDGARLRPARRQRRAGAARDSARPVVPLGRAGAHGGRPRLRRP